VEGVLGSIGTVAEHRTDDFMADVMAQVQQGHQDFLQWRDLARGAIVGNVTTFAVLTAFQSRFAPPFQLRQHLKEDFGEDRLNETK